jgi:exopolysaccharide biosynthesis polyprenyl glycosylphosphotransferase
VRFDSGLIPLFFNIKSVPTSFDYMRLLVIGSAFLLGTFCYLRLYNWLCFVRYLRTAKVIVKGTIIWVVAYLAICLILKFGQPISRMFMLISFGCVVFAMITWRLILFKIMHLKIFGVNFQQRILFVGWGKEAEHLEKEIQNDHNHPYEIIGCLPSPHGRLHRQPPSRIPVLGDYQNLATLLQQRHADVVILADLYVKMGEIIGLANLCEMEFAQFKVIPSYFEILASGLRLETIGGLPLLGVSELPLDRFSNRLIKRVIDIVGATVGLFLAIPIIAVFGALVYRESPGPILFRQKRVGRNGCPFHILKIRSMRMNAEENGAQWAKENDPRRLKIGAFMRKWNIDEVPQFFNVLKGDMSLVGPRPERPELISSFKHQIPHYHARHTCLPGMTGWAQVNGWRGNTSLEERIRFDIWYVEKWSIIMDIRILILTFRPQKNAY